MIADLHAHFPMHLLPPEEADTARAIKARKGQERFRAIFVDLLSRFFNYEGPKGGPSVTIDLMRQGDVGVTLSVLYSPLDEMDLSTPYGAPPEPGYFNSILRQIALVDQAAAKDPGAVVAHSFAELEQARADGKIVLVHCIEGGFALGATAGELRANVSRLAAEGVAYVGLAHLFWRQVATNAPALPFLPDWGYRLLFPQPKVGLSELGRTAVEAMLEHRVIVDVTHMSQAALDDTFRLLDERDPERRVPVIASHIACRLGGLSYNATDDLLRRIADRGGVAGVISCQHYICDGIRPRKPASLAETVDVIAQHVDRIYSVTGSFDHIAIGSDLDGYIKPALKGIEHLGRMRDLEAALVDRYGAAAAEQICSANALRVLGAGWGGP